MYMVVVGAPARWFAQGPIILLRQPCIYFAHLLTAEGPQVTQILHSTAYSSPTYAQKI